VAVNDPEGKPLAAYDAEAKRQPPAPPPYQLIHACPGAGKTEAVKRLRAQGFHVLDTDELWLRTPSGGAPLGGALSPPVEGEVGRRLLADALLKEQKAGTLSALTVFTNWWGETLPWGVEPQLSFFMEGDDARQRVAARMKRSGATATELERLDSEFDFDEWYQSWKRWARKAHPRAILRTLAPEEWLMDAVADLPYRRISSAPSTGAPIPQRRPTNVQELAASLGA